MEAASRSGKPSSVAMDTVKKIPNWAAAPNKNSFGLLSSGPKSIIAPIPMNSNSGSASDASIPTLNNHSIIPFTSPTPDIVWFKTPDNGRLTRMAPKPIGISKAGSKSFLIARKISRPPISHITTICGVIFWKPSIKNSIFSSYFFCNLGLLPLIIMDRFVLCKGAFFVFYPFVTET